jgi:hypothetical protein
MIMDWETGEKEDECRIDQESRGWLGLSVSMAWKSAKPRALQSAGKELRGHIEFCKWYTNGLLKLPNLGCSCDS